MSNIFSFRKIIFLVLLCCWYVAKSNNPENIRFVQLTAEQGLAHNHILSIFQDHKGFIWIGTRTGLCLYDGYQIKTYTCTPEDSTSLNHDFVKTIYEDSRQRLWLATDKGICRYNREQDNFVRYTDPLVASQFWGQSITETPDQRLLVSTSCGLYLYDEERDRFTPFAGKNKKPFLPNTIINEFVKDLKGNFWAASNHGLMCLDVEKVRKLDVLPEHPYSALLKRQNTLTLCIDQRQRIWLGTDIRGIFVYDPSDRSIENIDMKDGLSSNYIRCLICDNNGYIWAGTEHGINLIHSDTRKIKPLVQDVAGTSNLNDNAIYAIYKDKDHNIWVGTYFGGVNIHYKNFENFSTYSYGFSNKHLSGKAVRQIISDTDDSFWIATEDGGLNHFDRTTKTFEHYKNPTDKIGISYYNVHSLLKDKNGNLWIGTAFGGLNRYNLKTGQIKYYSPKLKNIPSNMIFCLREDREGTLWGATTNGLIRYVPEKDKFVQLQLPIVGNRFIHYFIEDSEGYFWLGTRRFGLFKLNPQTNTCTQISIDNEFQEYITYLYEDDRKNIWIGTNNGGISVYNREKNTIETYTTADGIPSNAIMAIIQDDEGDIWFSTSKGLCRLDSQNGTKTIYTTNDGLPINQFNYASAFKAKDGQLLFGSIDGMIAFYPQLLKDNKSKLHVELTDFKIHGTKVEIGSPESPLRQNITETSKIVLSHKEASSFGFEYTGLNYSHASHLMYAIRMKGIDSDWQQVGNQRQILFSNLPAGNYTLCIKASYDGQHWDEESTRCLDIVILPPFWLSWMAYVIYICLLLGSCYLAYRLIRVRIRLRMSLKSEHNAKLQSEELNKQKITFFTNVSHDLKTPLTLILAPLKKVIGDKNLTPEVREKLHIVLRNAQRMQYLIDELMTFSKIEMKRLKISVQEGDIINFIEEISHIFRMVAHEGGLNFITDFDPADRPRGVWFSPLKLERILYNLLSNAFKYTPAGGTITLSAHLEDKPHGETFLFLSVADTGIGIDTTHLEKIFENYYQVNKNGDKQGSGIGLALTKSLVHIHKGTIRVDSTPGEGSIFYVTLNVSASAYSEDEKSPVKLDKENITSYNYPLLATTDLLQEKLQEPIFKENGKYQILIVEDNKEMNDFIAEIFTENYMVIQAYNGQEGYETAIRTMPDLIISDVMMPVMDGFEMTRKLKSDLVSSHIPIILLTAKTGEENVVDGFSQGADVYIEKPFSSQSLELQIKNMLTTKYNNIQRFNHSSELDVKQITTNPRDEKFMNNLLELVMKNLDNDNFAVSDITSSLGISRSLLHIKLKSLANVSVTEFIRNIRMREAREKLISGMNVSETSFAVGISDPNYFTKCFKKQYGQTPSDFVRSIRKKK